MKKVLVLLVLGLSFWIIFPQKTVAQTPPDQGENIDILIEEYNPNTGPKRTPLIIPFEASYNIISSSISVLFLYPIGEVTITITNLTSSAMISTQVNSIIGNVIIPISLGSGIYHIEFVVEDGTTYGGSFIL